MPDFASTHQHMASLAASTNERSGPAASAMETDPSRTMEEEDEDDPMIPPPTPAVQFYPPGQGGPTGHGQMRTIAQSTGAARFGKHHEVHATPTGEMTSASSSSSLSSMTATLIGAGCAYPPVHALHQYVPLPHATHDTHTNATILHSHMAGLRSSLSSGSLGSQPSPISPAALIGQVHENLMLPPPRQGQSPLDQFQGEQNMSEQQQRHLAWLRDLNAMAKAAAAQTPSLSAPPEMSSTQTPKSPPNHVSFQHLLPEGMIYPPNFIIPMENKAPPLETAEKRAKRLERNRESARKSRRRKKERLLALEKQVNMLHGKIEGERRTQINAMVSKLLKCRESELHRVVPNWRTNDGNGGLSSVIAATGPCGDIVRAVQDFQHSLLKQTVLPRYHKLLLWFTVQPESFFAAGKEEYTNRMSRQNRPMVKVSSKQIGEELTSSTKEEEQGEGGRTSGAKRVTFQDTKAKEATKAATPEPSNMTTYANDAARVWPLICFEVGLGVDQEEKFISLHKKARSNAEVPVSYPQLTAAVASTDSLREATESLSRVIGQREANSFASVLNPDQVLAYHVWLAANKGRRSELLSRGKTSSAPSIDSSLHDICRRLHEVMRISMNEK